MSRNVAKLVNQYLSGRCTHDKYNAAGARSLIINNPDDDVREYGRTARADADKSTHSRIYLSRIYKFCERRVITPIAAMREFPI